MMISTWERALETKPFGIDDFAKPAILVISSLVGRVGLIPDKKRITGTSIRLATVSPSIIPATSLISSTKPI
jgi:hypothetical protein